MSGRLMFLVVLFSVSGVSAATFYLKEGCSDFSNPASYWADSAQSVEATALPGASDRIVLPAEAIAVNAATASFDVLASVSELRTSHDGDLGTILSIDVPSGAEKTIVGKFRLSESEADRIRTTLVKLGDGTLVMANASDDTLRLAANYDVRAGTLVFASASTKTLYAGDLLVASGAILRIETSSQYFFDALQMASGSLLTNALKSTQVSLRAHPVRDIFEKESVIAGSVGGKIRFWTLGNIRFESTENTNSGWPTVTENRGYFYSTEIGKQRGVLLARKIGMKKEASSFGKDDRILVGFGAGGGGLRYIGEGETSDRDLFFYSSPTSTVGDCAQPHFVDGGPNGGLTLNGHMQAAVSGSSTGPCVCRFFLTGDSRDECVFSGDFVHLSEGSTTYPFHITKTGSGVWRLADSGRCNHVGGLSILDGTLRFDSIAPRGTACSLGLSTVLTADDSRAMLNQAIVDYAFTLGGSTGVPVLEYTGKTSGTCADRPLVLAGSGGTLRASEGAFDFSDISARDAGSSPVLCLDSAGSGTYIARNIRDGAANAHVGVVKTGPGTWTLAGEQSFSGSLAVRDGELRVDPSGETDFLANVSNVQVCAKGTLTAVSPTPLSRLHVDAGDAGRLAGFAFAASGTLDLTGVPDAGLDALPGDYASCTGLSNLTNWTLQANGRPSERCLLFVEGEIRVLPRVLTLEIR